MATQVHDSALSSVCLVNSRVQITPNYALPLLTSHLCCDKVSVSLQAKKSGSKLERKLITIPEMMRHAAIHLNQLCARKKGQLRTRNAFA